jgi:hypothetical protein
MRIRRAGAGFLTAAACIATAAALASSAAATATAAKPNGSYSATFRGGIGRVEATFHKGKLTSFKATHVIGEGTGGCPKSQTTSLKPNGGSGWSKSRIAKAVVSQGETFAWGIYWNGQSGTTASAGLSGKVASSNRIKAKLLVAWDYPGQGGYLSVCNTRSQTATMKK